jgi:hypothetical protein
LFFRSLASRATADRLADALAEAEGLAHLTSGAKRSSSDARPTPASCPVSKAAKAHAPAATTSKAAAPSKATTSPKPAPARSEALTLLATLQREARLVDFLQEPLDGYSDAQIGAAVRDVHRRSAETVARIFALQPVAAQEEGAQIDVPDGAGAARFHLVGNVGASGPRRGALRHKGWQATRCQLPQWTGDEDARLVVAPAEVELS